MGGGKYLMDGKVWSAEAFRLTNEVTLSGSTETILGTQTYLGGGPESEPLLTVESSSADDFGPTLRVVDLTVTNGNLIVPGDVFTLTFGIDDLTWTGSYTVTGSESSFAPIAAGIAAQVADNTIFTMSWDDNGAWLTAKTRGTAMNAAGVDWTVTGDATAVATNHAATAGGDGVWAVRVDYLDGDGAAVAEIVYLNGTTPVTVSKPSKWVQKVSLAAANPNGDPPGTITCKYDGTTELTLASGHGATQSCVYMVPKGKQLRLGCITATSSKASAIGPSLMRIHSSYDPATKVGFAPSTPFDIASWWVGGVPEDLDMPYFAGPFHEGAILSITATGQNNHVVTVSADMYLESMGVLDTI